ncbi:amino acid permease [Stygiolobus caldivivus]|uniref:Amino acid permease n=1 Tax=Stygiolobus caldivivus TaxID=2824673 RepID=A0A8D5U7U7_9CREN|nr:amino acid permease [Stygiolobus caldivivus]BCU70938.1 amino acid permease [Stygiolobus caldivivus]
MSRPFLRESSGLVKNATLKDLVMLNVANMGAGLAVFEGISPYIQPGSVLWLTSLLTFLLTLPLVFTYTNLLMRMPRTGGDYVWISRKLNGKVGAVMGVAFAFNMPPYFALSAFFSVSAINLVLYEIGVLNRQPSLVYLSNNVFVNPYGTVTLTQDLLIYALGATAFIIIILINILRPKWGFTLTTVLGFFSVFTLVLAIAVVGLSAGSIRSQLPVFVKEFDLSPTSTSPWSFSWGSTLYMIPFFLSFAYIWLYAGPAVASEAKEGSLKWNLYLGSLITLLTITVPFLEMYVEVGCPTNTAYYPTFTYNFWSLAIFLSHSPILEWVLGLGLIAWNFFVMAFGVVVFARYVFAFAFDRLFPSIFAKLNKFASPVYAHLLDLATTLVFLSLPIISVSGATALYSYTPLALAYLILVSLAGVKVGLQEKSYPLLIGSALSTIIMALMEAEILDPYNNYGFSVVGTSGVNWIATGYILSLVGLGLVTYTLAKVIRKREGIDVDLVYKEIPPE